MNQKKLPPAKMHYRHGSYAKCVRAHDAAVQKGWITRIGFDATSGWHWVQIIGADQ